MRFWRAPATRRAIRDEQKLALDYRDELGRASERTVLPLALIYYSEHAMMVAWCEMRQYIRNFRADRVEHCEPLDIYFQGQGERLRQLWVAGWRADVGRPLATADG